MRLYFDVNTIIQVVEAPQSSAERFAELVTAGARLGTAIVTSELSLAEVLVKPLRDQDFQLIVAYNNLLSGDRAGPMQTIPISREILGLAARVRNKKPSVKLPDAIHIATAELMQCNAIVTADQRWTGATAIQLNDPGKFDLVAFIELFS